MGKYGDEKGSKKRKKKNDFQKEKRKEPISEAYFGFGASPSTGALPQGPGASRRHRLGLAPPLLQLPLLVLRRQLSHQRRHPPGDLVPDWRPLLVREAVRVRQIPILEVLAILPFVWDAHPAAAHGDHFVKASWVVLTQGIRSLPCYINPSLCHKFYSFGMHPRRVYNPSTKSLNFPPPERMCITLCHLTPARIHSAHKHNSRAFLFNLICILCPTSYCGDGMHCLAALAILTIGHSRSFHQVNNIFQQSEL
mmetsp:Transcript_42090/g.68575  ORF Transcript_42090/g.68575 Transcript_42090/m.68575 type:complete len:252 (-) Transcript_42090:363-1118(-)